MKGFKGRDEACGVDDPNGGDVQVRAGEGDVLRDIEGRVDDMDDSTRESDVLVHKNELFRATRDGPGKPSKKGGAGLKDERGNEKGNAQPVLRSKRGLTQNTPTRHSGPQQPSRPGHQSH